VFPIFSRGARLALAALVVVTAAAGPARSTAPSVELTGAGYFGPAMGLDFVSAQDGFALYPSPAINNAGSAGAPSELLSTTDGGQVWTARTIPPADGQMQAVSFTSATSGWAVSLLSADAGNGWTPLILHTANGGKSWTAETVPASVVYVSSIDFANAHHGWVAAQTSGDDPAVAATSDGGQQWSLQTLPLPAGFGMVTSIAFTSARDGWAAGEVNGAPFILDTTNGGTTWTSETVPAGVTRISQIATAGADAWAVAASGSAETTDTLISSQGGGAWEVQSAPVTDELDGVAFSSAEDGWATGFDISGSAVVLETIDGGGSWTVDSSFQGVTSPAAVAASGDSAWVLGTGQCGGAMISGTVGGGTSWQPQLAMAPALNDLTGLAFPTRSTGWTLAGACGDQPLQTSDAGSVWTPAPFPFSIQTQAVAFPDSLHGWVLGDTVSGTYLYATANGGSSWLAQTLPDAPTQGYYSLTFADDLHGWALGNSPEGAVMAGTVDGGGQWNSENIPGGLNLTAMTAAGASDVWAVGGYSTGLVTTAAVVIASTDGGATWSTQSLPPGVGTLQDVDFVNAMDGWAVGVDSAVTGGVIVATTDGGTTWTQETDLPVSSGIVSVSFASASLGWATAWSTAHLPLLLETTDGGTSWTSQTVPTGLSGLGAIDALTKGEVLMLGYDPGPVIERSTDGGAKWTPATIFDPAWIAVSPSSGPPGSISVTGQGFAPGETVTVAWNSTTGTELGTATADGSGSFSTTVTVPSVAAGSYKVYAVGQLSLSAPYATLTAT